MPVWTLANMKGGVAKTTSALMLAQAAQRAGCRVLLVDLDLNAQLSRLLDHWPAGQAGAFAGTPAPVRLDEKLSLVPAPGADFPLDGALDGQGLADRLAALTAGHDLCIIDTPSGYVPFLRPLLRLSDVWITPTPLTPAVRQASAHYLLRMARLALGERTRLKVRLLPVQFNAHLGSHRIGLEALRRFVGPWRVLPPVRQDAHLTGVLSDTAPRLTPARQDYLDVCRTLGVC